MKKGLLFKCIAIPLLVGIVAALLTGGGMELFETIENVIRMLYTICNEHLLCECYILFCCY